MLAIAGAKLVNAEPHVSVGRGTSIGSSHASTACFFRWNGIRHDGAEHLAQGLAECTNLSSLCLSYNSIFAVGARALANTALPHLPKVQRGMVFVDVHSM